MEDNKKINPFTIGGKTYHTNASPEQIEKMREWLKTYEIKKQDYQAKYPSLKEIDYINMSFIWLLGEIVEIQQANLHIKTEQAEIEDIIQTLNKDIESHIR